MREIDPMPDEPRGPLPPQPAFREIAREEFWIVAKAFFAPVYGTYLVWKQLLSLTQKVDRKALGLAAPQPPSQPAE
ncbi:MAG: hypothetical protein QOG72_1498 [Sphingomonadales bacterium]|jgi:hypothetical protein|nr:hypothetical protein [Sphingomonadales bacterium]